MYLISNSINVNKPEYRYFEMIKKKYTFVEAIDCIDEIDWDFKNFETQYGTHSFHPYPARFIPQIPLTLIKLFTSKNEIVLDPFCGGGTTLVEATLNNRKAIGNDLNPLAVLISKVKTTLISQNKFRLLNDRLLLMQKYTDLDRNKINYSNRLLDTISIFNHNIINEVNSINEFIFELKDDNYQSLFDFTRVALSSTLWLLLNNNNSNSMLLPFTKKIKSMQKEILFLNNVLTKKPNRRLICGDSRNIEVESNSVHLVVTSPPYVNALDYHKIHMYNLLWLGYDFERFRKNEIGGHYKYKTNRFRLLVQYLSDMLKSLIEMNRVLLMDRLCCIVIGNSSLEYELIENHKFIITMAEKVGFKLIKLIFRNIDISKKYLSQEIGKINNEYILIMKKTDESIFSISDSEAMIEIVEEQMIMFEKQIKIKQGSSVKTFKKPSKERLKDNINRIKKAIDLIPKDIKQTMIH